MLRNSKTVTSIVLSKDNFEFGKQKARSQDKSFSCYLDELIKKDKEN